MNGVLFPRTSVGKWSILKQKEYAVLVFFAAVLGSGLFVLLVMELVGIIE